MRTSPLTSLFLAFSSLVSTTASKPLAPRAYSVIPVDGGAADAAAGNDAGSNDGYGAGAVTVTVHDTVTVTEKAMEAKTVTVVDVQEKPQTQSIVTVTEKEVQTVTIQATSAHPPSPPAEEETVFVTTTIPGATHTLGPVPGKETVYVTVKKTVEHRPTETRAPGQPPVIYVDVPTTLYETIFQPTTVFMEMGASATFLSSTTKTETTSSGGATLPETVATETSTGTSAEASSEPTPAYDDGQWKTTYPHWRNSTAPTPVVKREVTRASLRMPRNWQIRG